MQNNKWVLPEDTAITLGEDGIYRWRGTTDLKKNPTTLYTILKGMGFGLGLMAAVMAVILLSDSSINRSGVPIVMGITVLVIAIALALTVLIYFIYAHFMGTYNADYYMDETGVLFAPGAKEAAVTRAMGLAAAAAGAAAGSYGVTIAGIVAGEGMAQSVFDNVRRVKGIRKHNVIKVSQLTLYAQVYVAPQDYDFVFSFIRDHCPKAHVNEA